MPSPRMTNPAAKAKLDPFSGPSEKATVLGKTGDASNAFYVTVAGRIVPVVATIDAPIAIGDIVWVQITPQGYILQGTA